MLSHVTHCAGRAKLKQKKAGPRDVKQRPKSDGTSMADALRRKFKSTKLGESNKDDGYTEETDRFSDSED